MILRDAYTGVRGGEDGRHAERGHFFRMKLVYSGEGFGAGWGRRQLEQWRVRDGGYEPRRRRQEAGHGRQSGAIRAAPSPTLSLRRSMARVEAAVMEDTGAGGRRQEGEYARL